MSDVEREKQYQAVLDRLVAEERPKPSLKPVVVKRIAEVAVEAHNPDEVRKWLQESSPKKYDIFTSNRAPQKKNLWNAAIGDEGFDADAPVPEKVARDPRDSRELSRDIGQVRDAREDVDVNAQLDFVAEQDVRDFARRIQ